MEGAIVAVISRVSPMKVPKQIQESVVRTLYASAPLADGSAAADYRVKDQSATGTFWGNQAGLDPVI
jgi:hypothetical protein